MHNYVILVGFGLGVMYYKNLVVIPASNMILLTISGISITHDPRRYNINMHNKNPPFQQCHPSVMKLYLPSPLTWASHGKVLLIRPYRKTPHSWAPSLVSTEYLPLYLCFWLDIRPRTFICLFPPSVFLIIPLQESPYIEWVKGFTEEIPCVFEFTSFSLNSIFS